jgi:hypothetical protein
MVSVRLSLMGLLRASLDVLRDPRMFSDAYRRDGDISALSFWYACVGECTSGSISGRTESCRTTVANSSERAAGSTKCYRQPPLITVPEMNCHCLEIRV